MASSNWRGSSTSWSGVISTYLRVAGWGRRSTGVWIVGQRGPRLNASAYLDARTRTKTKYRDLSTAQRTMRPSVATTPASKCARWGPGCFGRDDVCLGWVREQATARVKAAISVISSDVTECPWVTKNETDRTSGP